MAKRIVSVFLFICIFIGISCLGILTSFRNYSVQSDSTSGNLRIVVGKTRGTVYDCNMQKLTNNDYKCRAVVRPDDGPIQKLQSVLTADEFESVYERLCEGNPVLVDVPAELADKNIDTFKIPERYSSDQPAVHILGYTDGSGRGVSGIEKSYDDILNKYAGECSVRIFTNARGKVLSGCDMEIIDDTSKSRGGVCLTIDREIQHITEEAMRDCGLEKGAAVVVDVKTGEIRAMASLPVYDCRNVKESLNDPDDPFINRALTPYSVGSVFKCFIAAAALEQADYSGFTYNCTGRENINGIEFNCHEHNGHGELDLEQALVNSCNTYFIKLASELDPQLMLDCLVSFNFGLPTELAPDMVSPGGVLPEMRDLSVGERANLSFGQGKLLATPLQIAMATACIANGGIYNDAALVKGTVDGAGELHTFEDKRNERRVVSQKTADKIKQYMISVVENGSGRGGKPENGSAGGKTATAQSGIFSGDREILRTWFSGFFPADDPRYVVTIMKEDGTTGAGDCAPVFRKIAENIDFMYSVF
ncbi:MAG: penicillin-binding protein 2 [Clostridiales bacterium]|nr:penicillin-binding protein 2 [Clostridiales bacterium]